MLKTQITGAKYLSPQTNQMTNLNIAVPADSKDTEFGTSDILLAKDVVTYLNALDSDISKELDTQTDKINKINQSIKQLIDHNLIKIVTELPTTDIDKNCIYLVPNKDGEGNNVFIEYIYVESKNTFEEVGRIQAKVDLSDYYTKEETDNQIQIAKNSAINIHNEDNTRYIKLDINDSEAIEDYGSPVNVSLTDPDNGSTININTADGFRHSNSNGYYSNLSSASMYVGNGTYDTYINSDRTIMSNNDINGSIKITTNKELTEDEQDNGYSPVDITLNDGDYNANINANRLVYKEQNDNIGQLDSTELYIQDGSYQTSVTSTGLAVYFINYSNDLELGIVVRHDDDKNALFLGNDYKVGISRIIDNTEGATITGVKSIAAFANPSATKVWATDGSTVDLTTKANTSDVLLKKSASGGYYIEENSNQLGEKAFAANSICTASGIYSFAEGGATASGIAAHAEGSATASGTAAHAEGSATASGDNSHAEGDATASGTGAHAEGVATASGTSAHAEGQFTSASGEYSHAEGFATYSYREASHSEGSNTKAQGNYAHAEGRYTEAAGFAEHAQGAYNVVNKNAIHSVGIGNDTTRKNAEYIYAKNNENGYSLTDDPKNGYKYLIGVGGYDGISTDNTTYKSVQEVIADLTARIEQLETKVRALEAANTPA